MNIFLLFINLNAMCGLSTGLGLFSTDNKHVNGGIPCAACTFIVGLVEQLAEVHNETVTDVVDNLCNLLPSGGYRIACADIVDRYGPLVIDLLYQKATPDIVCHGIKFCHVDPGQRACHLFPMPHNGSHLNIEKAELIGDQYITKKASPDFPDEICEIPGIRFICDLYDKIFKEHSALVDLDGDGFSTIETLRGTSWRGRDCSDSDSGVYPGTRPSNSDIELDSNCNGIYGVDPKGQPYEDLFCKDTPQLGVGILGDSAGAHFHIPPEWLQAKVLNKDLLTHLRFVVENEFDWPMMSATTGFMNVTWPIIHGPVQSIYTKMRTRNRCMHRDYQNLGVNGANCMNLQQYQLSLSRNQTADHPMLLFLALVGNDVCNGHPDTVAHMTTPQQMRENTLKTFRYLDTKLPLGSHVVIISLADGRVLYENMHKRYHPFGQVNKDVKYSDFYNFMQCLQISPCNGWMTTNATLRELTFKRVQELNTVLKDIAVEYKNNFTHFDIDYLECPLMPVIEQYEREHGRGSGWQLIEPVDGFHPNQYAMELSALYTWKYLQRHKSHFLGKVNPHNRKIGNIFGDQNGY